MIKTKYKIPLYGGKFIVIKTNDMQSVLEKYGFKIDASKYGAFTFERYKNDYFRVIVIFDSCDIPLIAHEAVHVVNAIFNHAGIKPDVINDEPQAYLTQWVVKKIYKALNGGV